MKKIVLALIIAVVGVFAVSSIAATHLLKNSHVFKETTMNSSFCEKCHTEQVEGMAITASEGNHGVMTDCEVCHAKSGNAHAATTEGCESCHSSALAELQSENEAHNGMLGQDDPTVACVSCHTTHNANVSAAYTEETQWTMG